MSTNSDGDGNTCGAPPKEWASLMLTIFSVNVSWWLLYVPTIWKHGFRSYLDKVKWQCLRQYMPSVAALVTLKLGEDKSMWPGLYYHGPSDPDSETETGLKPVKGLRFAKVIITDSATIIATIMNVVEFCQMGKDSDVSGLNSTLFIFPSLPGALYGLCFVVGSRLKLRRRYIVALGAFVLAGVLVAFTLVMRFVPASNSNLWYPPMLLYLYMTLPLAFFQAPFLDLIQVTAAALARVGGIAVGAMSSDAYFPYCELKNKVFGGFYLAMGLLGGVVAFYAKYKWDPFPWSREGVGRSLFKDDHQLLKNILRNIRRKLQCWKRRKRSSGQEQQQYPDTAYEEISLTGQTK